MRTGDNIGVIGATHFPKCVAPPGYPAYKDSGVAWLGEIPSHWEVRRLKYLSSISFSNVDKHTFEDEKPVYLCNYTDVYHNDYITPEFEFMKASASPDEIRKFALKRGDVIVTKDSETWKDIAVPAYITSDFEEVLCGYHLALIRPNSTLIDGVYLFRSLLASQINTQFKVAANGVTRYGLGKYWLDNALFLVPPLPEQRAIAAFLDERTAALDAAIAEYHRLSALLQEHRAALISRAVTQGLDPDAPRKDSGIAWLGEIPSHWETKPLRAIAYFQRGHDLTKNERLDGNVPVLSSSGIFFYHNEAKAKGPGVVTGRYGTVGQILYVEQDYWPMNTTLYVKEFYGNEPRYIYYLLTILPFDAYAGKSAVPGIDRNDLHPLHLVCPSVEEQRAIAAYLDAQTARIDAARAEIEIAIAHLEEYRAALIAAAVTGKIDVRYS